MSVLSLGALACQIAIALLLVEALRRRETAAAVNALASLGVATLPALVELVAFYGFGRHVSVEPVLSLWIGVAGVLHSLGMLGLYEKPFGWDHLTHTVSAALLAALFYAGTIVTMRQTPGSVLLGMGSATSTLAFALASGVFWEVIELVARDVAERLDVEPVLIHYGWRDTALDLVFDLVGALLVVGLDFRLFVPLARRFPRVTQRLVFASWGIVIVGTILLGAGVAYRAASAENQ